MILRSVGIAGAIVVGLAVASALTLLPAILAIVGPRVDRAGGAPGRDPRRGADGPWARLARRVMRHPVAVLVPTLALLLVLGVAVPARPVQRAGRDDPAARPSRRGRPTTSSPSEFGEGEFAPLVAGDPDDRRRHDAGERRRRCTTTRAGSRPTRASRRVDEPRRRRPAPRRSRSTSCSTATPGGPPDRFVATALAATTKGDLTAFTVYTPYGPNRDEGRALVHDLRDPAARSRRRPG